MTFSLSKLRGTKLFADLASKLQQSSLLISMLPNLDDGGSGTLIRYKNLCGILTALHVVVDNLNNKTIFSPTLKTEDINTYISKPVLVKKFLYIETGEGLALLKSSPTNWEEEILDICLIELEKEVFEKILKESGKIAIDLYEHQLRYRNDSGKYDLNDNCNNWTWRISGAPRFMGTHNEYGVYESRYDGLYLSGGRFACRDLKYVLSDFHNTADLVYHDIGETLDDLPEKFKGMSGAGAWQISFYGEIKPERIAEVFFGGVYVAETPKMLISNGPSSLYDIFTSFLDSHASKI